MAVDPRTERADTTLTADELAALDAVAEEHGVSRAAMLRLVLLSHLPEHAISGASYGLISNVPEVHRECRLARARLVAARIAVVDAEPVA